MEVTFWDKKNETIDRESLSTLQLKHIQNSVDHALKTQFYARRLKSIGIKSGQDIEKLGDLNKIPFTTKDDLRVAYPEGLLSVDRREVIRLHTSSGTTGTPIVIYHTRSDIDNWTELLARCIVSTGVNESDVFQNMTNYGLFTGGLGFHYGAERAGILVIPASSGNTRRQLMLMRDFGTTVVHATPSYLLHIASQLEPNGFKRSDFKLRKAFLGAEPYSEETRLKLQEILSIDVYNSYGLTEMNGPGVAFECVYKNGMHVWEDSYYMEVIDPDTKEIVEDGQQGEIVFTTLKRTATPILRYRTRDLSSVLTGECPCGRTHRRISRIKGRTDDMLIINGVNVFPSQIEDVLMKMPLVGTNYLITLEKQGALDKITVATEISSKFFTGEVSSLDQLKNQLQSQLKDVILVNTVVELHEPGGLPVSEGKAKRVIDNRPKS